MYEVLKCTTNCMLRAKRPRAEINESKNRAFRLWKAMNPGFDAKWPKLGER